MLERAVIAWVVLRRGRLEAVCARSAEWMSVGGRSTAR
jgi:hypothetical protein